VTRRPRILVIFNATLYAFYEFNGGKLTLFLILFVKRTQHDV